MGLRLLTSDQATIEQSLEMTVLYRKGRPWVRTEITSLLCELNAPVSQHMRFPEHVALYDHHPLEKVRTALANEATFMMFHINSVSDPNLPFTPFFDLEG